MEVVDELAAADLASRLPDQQRADRILPENGIEQSTDLLLAPDKRPLNVGQPEPTLFLGIVEECDDLAEGMLRRFHDWCLQFMAKRFCLFPRSQ